jgi:hypothetical protein
MANSLGSLTSNLISSIMLEATLKRLAPLRLMTSDFSGEALDFGQAIKVRTATPASVADYNTSTGYVAANATTTDYTVTLDKHKHVTLAFNDQEYTGTKRGLIEEQVRVSAYALADQIIVDTLALVVAATFTNTTEFCLEASFDRAQLLKLRSSLNLAGAPDTNRLALLTTGAFTALTGDAKIISRDYSDSDNIDMGSGALRNVAGFSGVYEVPSMAVATVRNGFALHPSALCIATRVPKDPGIGGANIPGVIENITDPNTGFTLQSRTWYDMKLGTMNQTWTVMYGVAAGVVKHLTINRNASS